jgi:hypothetical protein
VIAQSGQWLERDAPAALRRWEPVIISLAAWVSLLAIPLMNGELGLSWDALNHHIYLGWTAERHRFDRDFLAAGYQSTQAPYLYWPAYKMALAGWSGPAAAAVLATLHVLAVWPVWKLARVGMPGTTNFDVAMRALAVALALLSGIVLSAVGSTMTDVLGAVPLLWAVALALEAATQHRDDKAARRAIGMSGLLTGVAVAVKLSNGPLAVLMPLLWLCAPGRLAARLQAILLGCFAAATGAAIFYGHWGWLLWRAYGNPVYPFYDHWFAPLRAFLGWTG